MLMDHSLPMPALKFLEAIRPWQHAYTHNTFTYVTMQSDGNDVLVRGRLALRAFAPPSRRGRTRSTLFSADEVDVGVTQPLALEALLSAVASGEGFLLGQDTVRLLQGPSVQVHHERLTHDEPAVHGYVHRLTIDGVSRWPLLANLDVEFEHDLGAHGFRSIEELVDDYGFKLSSRDCLSVEVIAEPVARIDRASKLSRRTAHVQVELASAISPDAVSLTIVGSPGGDRHERVRRRVSGNQITWEHGGRSVGRCAIELPHHVIASCRVTISNALHDELRLINDASPNRRRVLVELADPGLKRLREPLINPRNEEERREFEPGIAALLYMLGFDSVRIGAHKKLSDAADIFAMTASRAVLIVECTTEVLDPRGKLQKLLARVEGARVTLCETWPDLTANRIEGLLVVPRPAADLEVLMRTARQHGVLVLAREEIEHALEQTQFAADADAMLARWRERSLNDFMTKGLDA